MAATFQPGTGDAVTAYAVTLKKAAQPALPTASYTRVAGFGRASGIVSVATSSFAIDDMAGSAEEFAPPGL